MAFTRRAIAELRAADGRLPWGDSVPPTNSMVPVNASGIPVNQRTAEGIDTVFSCCGLIADSVSSLPQELRTGPVRRGSKLLPASPLMEQPYVELSRRDWWVQFIWALALRGNFYGQRIEFNPDGSTRQIKPIDNDQVMIKRLGNGQLEYQYYGVVIPPNQVFHIRYQSRPGSILGLSPIQACALTFGTAIAQQRYVESFYLNQAAPHGVIQVPGYLDRVETRKMMRGWIASHQGFNNTHLPAILTEGATFNPVTISPTDAQLLEALGWSAQTIAGRIFRVPPHMVGMVDRTTSWGRGIEQMERGFFTNTLIGYLTAGIEAMTKEHAPGEFFQFNTTERTRGAILERAQAAGLLMGSGVGVADDLREWFDWDELPGGIGDLSYIPINTQLLEAATFALEQSKKMAEEGATMQPAIPGAGTPDQTPPAPAPPPTRPPAPASAQRGIALDYEQAWRQLYDALLQPLGPEAAKAAADSLAAAFTPQRSGNGGGKAALTREQAEAIITRAQQQQAQGTGIALTSVEQQLAELRQRLEELEG